MQSTTEFLLNAIPNTVVDAFAKGEILQVLLFSVLFGFALHAFGAKGKPVFELIDKLSHVLFGIVGIIMKVAPLGAFGAMAFTIGKYGLGTLLSLAKLMGTFYATCLFFIFVVLGIIVWGTMQFASYAVFGHRRPLAAVVVIGIVLVLNMGMTDHEQLNYMIVFTGASLFLLIQMHAFDERATWIRRRIGDPSTISALYLRGGTIFIVAAMLISMLFTNRAASAPLAGAWSGVGNRLVGVGQEISRLLPLGGALRPRVEATLHVERRNGVSSPSC